MPFTASDVLRRASIVLQDAGAVRWPLPELLMWLNDGTREIALLKPNAAGQTVAMPLVAGTKQEIPANAHSLLEVVRNLDPNTGAGLSVITPIIREVLDQQMPGWHDSNVIPFGNIVRHVADNALDQRMFYVVPGNDGTGSIEVVVSVIPAEIPTPTDMLNIAVYVDVVPMQDIYRSALVDYILYRAFSKDMNLPGAGQRATAHYGQFMNALGMKAQGEAAAAVPSS